MVSSQRGEQITLIDPVTGDAWVAEVLGSVGDVVPGSIMIPYIGIGGAQRLFEKRNQICWWVVLGIISVSPLMLAVIECCPAMNSVRIGKRMDVGRAFVLYDPDW